MEDLLKQILEEQKKTNELLKTQNKDPNELLTIKQIHEETGIGTNMIQKMFNDPELPVQKYTSPFKVTRQAFNNYINVKHDYLRSIKEWEMNEKNIFRLSILDNFIINNVINVCYSRVFSKSSNNRFHYGNSLYNARN